jgi:hypothetical protein
MKSVNTNGVKSLANIDAIHNPYALNGDEIESLKNWAGLSKKEREASNFLVDALYANGKKPHHFVAFNEAEDKQGISFRDHVCKTIVEGYNDASLMKLWVSDAKVLKTSDVVAQKGLREVVRKDYNNLKGALTTRINQGDKATKAKPATKDVLALRAIKQALTYLGEVKEGYEGMPEDIKALKALKINVKVIDKSSTK